MKKGFRIIDAEPHFSEPSTLWEERLDEPYRSLTARVTSEERGLSRGRGQLMEGNQFPTPALGNATIDKLFEHHLPNVPVLGRAGAGEPEAFLEGFDIEGIDVGLLMPSPGAIQLTRVDGLSPRYSLAVCRARNDWAYELTRSNPERLKWWALLPPHDPHLAAEEAHRCVEELDAVGVAMTNGAVNGVLRSDAFFDPLWEELDRLGAPIGFHGTASGRMRDNIQWRYSGHRRVGVTQNVIRSPFHNQTSAAELILGGVLERYPNLKVAFMESGVAWLPWLLSRMDFRWKEYGEYQDYTLSLKPSEYFRRQCYAVMDPEEEAVKYLIDYMGAENILISTDFPHPDSLFPEAINQFLAREDISEESKRKILWDNPAKLAGIAAATTREPVAAR